MLVAIKVLYIKCTLILHSWNNDSVYWYIKNVHDVATDDYSFSEVVDVGVSNSTVLNYNKNR